METDARFVECLRSDSACVITPTCVLSGMLNLALSACTLELTNYTLAEYEMQYKKRLNGV